MLPGKPGKPASRDPRKSLTFQSTFCSNKRRERNPRMSPIIVNSTIQPPNKSSKVQVAMEVGFANFATAKINLKPKVGTLTTLIPDVEADTNYSLGSASDLINNRIRMILAGTVGDPNGAVHGSFFVTCAFFQNRQSIGSSDPVSGNYAPGDALQQFDSICSFS